MAVASATGSPPGPGTLHEPEWPACGSRRPIFLIDASSKLEKRLLEDWIERHRPEGATSSAYDQNFLPPSRRPIARRRFSLSRLDSCLASEGDSLLCPLRVVWMARERAGRRSVAFRDLLTFGDPRDPGRLRQAWIARRAPDRCRIVAGEPAPASELRERWQRAGHESTSETVGLASFVARQAGLALERAERRLRGARYKVPRLVHEDILGQPSFRGGLRRLAREQDRSTASIERKASSYLKEIAATHSPFVIDLVSRGIRKMYSRGYGEAIHYDHEELERVKALSQRHPVVFLPSHKSNLDHLVLHTALHENGHPPNHTAGGINMNFFPVGPLARRSGIFFIRRTFKDNPVYKFVLHHYIDYLIDKRFSLEWYIEGGRSRSGKLLPPRFGMLSYVVDAFRRGKSDDVMLIPVSIAYDQIQDVGEYAAEQSGKPKEREGFSWFLRMIRRLGHRYGEIYFRFGEPISLAKTLGPGGSRAEPNSDEDDLEVQKLAFEVAFRINRVTPITESSLLTLALLGVGDQAVTVAEATRALANLLAIVERRDLPRVGDLGFLATDDGIRRALDALVENGVVSRFAEGPEPVYRIGSDQQLSAAYYRNTIVHFFVNAAIAELALLRAAEEGVDDPLAEFWDEAMRLRDLLKFEFFFADKDVFRGELRREVSLQEGDWESGVRGGREGITALVQIFRPFSAHRVLRPFLDAYRLLGDLLERADPARELDQGRFISECLGLGRQYLLQHRIRSAASVSQELIRSAWRLADSRDLLGTGGDELTRRRREFADEIRAGLRRVAQIEALAVGRRAGLID
jgi:glycerol-3-phosphate O-acyltransferase